MALLTRDELKDLAGNSRGLCTSLYLPTHRAGPEVQQDPIRLQNLLRGAERELVASGMRKEEADDYLARARELLKDTMCWQHQEDGLAVFLAEGTLRTYRLPMAVRELGFVGDRWYLKPLLPLLIGDGRFFILALSQNRVRLFEGNREGAREVDLRAIPSSLRDAVGYDYEQKTLQFRSSGPRGGGRRGAMFHGHGAGKDTAKDEILTFFRQVDEGIGKLIEDRNAPLVLATVDYLAPLYREVTKHGNVLEKVITGNPDKLDGRELHGKAWSLLEPRVKAERDRIAARFPEMRRAAKATAELPEVLIAADEGRVETLFVGRGVERWGRFDRKTRKVEQRHERQTGDADLVEVAAVTCLLKGAAVYAIDPSRVPGGGLVAALFRY